MKKITIGILAHVDSGKTTLSESLLFNSGIIRTLGRVDHKNTFLDTFELERKRGITIFSKQAHFNSQKFEITLLDTPGHVDFSAETERTLQVLDAAILIVSAASGVQSHTETLWRLLRKHNIRKQDGCPECRQANYPFRHSQKTFTPCSYQRKSERP